MRSRRVASGLFLLMVAAAGPAAADASPLTTQSTITAVDPNADFTTLKSAPGWPRQVRQELAQAKEARQARRRSLIYLTALDEIHYTDEESPARVEFLDFNEATEGAWFPFEALRAFSVDQVFRTVNAFRSSPIAQGSGTRASMALALTTGDNVDNQQRDETEDFIRLLEGGPLDPNSGVETTATCPAGPIPAGEAPQYTGVQDYDDYVESGAFYDPDTPQGDWAAWPTYTGLMNRAQLPFQAQGLDVPSYVSLGNHDRLQQGNQYSNASFEAVATGCAKIYEGNQTAPVPRDPERRSLSYPQLHAMYDTGAQADAHGFKRVDPAELAASNGAASYYSWSPRPGVRMIALNTLSEGGQTGPSAEGNLDDPQFQWLKGELAKARAAGQLVILFGHHPIASMESPIPDENAPACGPNPNTDPNKGCDLDPRASTPIHQGPELEALLKANRNVVAYIAGHTTVNRIIPFQRAGGGGFWQIESGSVSDWPNQARLVELMDNRDGTLSIFGTMLAQNTPIDIPVPPTQAGGFTPSTLASIDRVFAFNDALDRNAADERIGLTLNDRNVELLLPDPRKANLKITKSDDPDPVRVGGTMTFRLLVENLGPSRATAVSVWDRLPKQTSFVSAQASSGSCSLRDEDVICRVGDIGVGGKQRVTITATVQGGPRTMRNYATAAAVTDDPAPQNNTDTETTQVIR